MVDGREIALSFKDLLSSFHEHGALLLFGCAALFIGSAEGTPSGLTWWVSLL